jgi:hypothetical protein
VRVEPPVDLREVDAVAELDVPGAHACVGGSGRVRGNGASERMEIGIGLVGRVGLVGLMEGQACVGRRRGLLRRA